MHKTRAPALGDPDPVPVLEQAEAVVWRRQAALQGGDLCRVVMCAEFYCVLPESAQVRMSDSQLCLFDISSPSKIPLEG